MRRRLLAICSYKLFSEMAQAFIDAVIADGGFVEAERHIHKVFLRNKDADLICPMSAGKEDKLYYWSE